MSIRYSGQVRLLTHDVVSSFAQIVASRVPESVPVQHGTVEVRPQGALATIVDGEFSVDVDDRVGDLSAYRLLVTTRLDDPCTSQRERAREARRQLDVARRDGESQRGLDRLEADLLAHQRELVGCVERAGHTTGTTTRDVIEAVNTINASEGVTWSHSSVSEDKQRTFCIYDGPSPDTIRTAAERSGLPVDSITAVTVLDAHPYR